MGIGPYTVLLSFDPGDDQLRQRVVQGLAKIDPSASGRLVHFTRGRIIVKKNVSLTTAKRLASALQKTGATCTIQKQPIDPSPSSPGQKSSRACKVRSPELITCPNCNRQQPPANECRICGVIIEKAHRHRERTPRKHDAKPHVQKTPNKNKVIGNLRKRLHAAFGAWIKKRPIQPLIIVNWWKRLVDRMFSCVIVFAVALVLETCLLYLFKLMWYIYLATEVGRYYVTHFPKKTAAIQRLMDMDLLLLSWDTTLMVLYAGLLLSVMARFFHLIRYLFDSQGLLGKLIFWCAPTAVLAAWAIVRQYQLPYYLPAIGLVLVPTICIVSSCIQLARDTMPEIGMLWNMVAKSTWKENHHLWIKIKQKWHTWIDTDS